MTSKPPAWLVDDPSFDAHVLGGPERPAYHPERPERLTAARAAASSAHVDWRACPARPATDDELTLVHTAAYVESLAALRGMTGYLDPDTYVAPRTADLARLAAGGAVALVDELLSSDVHQGVALLRPPGHHAREGEAMGFCLLNNVAVAAAHAVARGVRRVLVVDWDVHHGNGTQEMFWGRADVLYVSLHQSPFYPGTGAASEVGEGDGQGYTVNIPVTAGGSDDLYRAAFERVVLPVAREYAPELVLVSAGFDASLRDPLAQMRLSPAAFGWMGRALRGVADESAGGKIALVLEGGYDLLGIESGLSAAIQAITGGGADDVALPDHTPDDVLRAEAVARRGWKLG